MDMLPSEYIKVSYFWPKSAKKSFCFLRVSKKLKKIEKIFFIKPILNIIYELCQHLVSLRSLQRPKPQKGALNAPPPFLRGGEVWGFIAIYVKKKFNFLSKILSCTTVVAQRVRYFVLLNYTYKSWSIIKTSSSFGICSS